MENVNEPPQEPDKSGSAEANRDGEGQAADAPKDGVAPPRTSDPGYVPYDREASSESPPPQFGGPEPPPGFAHYPRYSYGAYGKIPPAPAQVRFAAIGESWDLIRQDFGTYLVAMLIYGIISYVFYQAAQYVAHLYGVPYLFNQRMSLDQVLANPAIYVMSYLCVLVTEVIMFVLGAGYFSMCLRRLRGEPINAGYLFDGVRHFGRVLVAGMIAALTRNLLALFLIIPGMLAAGALVFVPLILIDQRTGAFEAIRLSYLAARKDLLMMGLLCFVLAAIAWAGCCGCVGFIITGPIYFMVIAMHYHAYFPPQDWPKEATMIQVAPQYSV